MYLAAILDLFSRRVVGWALSKSNDTALARSALDREIVVRKPQPGLLHHSVAAPPLDSQLRESHRVRIFSLPDR